MEAPCLIAPNTVSHNPQIYLYDEVIQEPLRTQVDRFLETIPWQFGATSDMTGSAYPYWYSHFAGIFDQRDVQPEVADCTSQLSQQAPIIATVWNYLKGRICQNHILVRCYANSYPYGSEGTVHRDTNDTRQYTAIFYPHSKWDLNWAGETIFFKLQQPPEILAAIWPRPNRLVLFQGIIPHVARGISRSCPVLRRTLMFKTAKGCS